MYFVPHTRAQLERLERRRNALNVLLSSKYRHPENDSTQMGKLHQLEKAFAILAVMMHGPNILTELSQHNAGECLIHWIFLAAAQHALSKEMH